MVLYYYNDKHSLNILNGNEVLFLSQYHKTKYNDISSIDKQVKEFPRFVPRITSKLILH